MNPFEVKTPEDVSASEVYELFVDVFTDFYQVKEVGHTFLNGPRGSGKSMMFRYMMPDCQMIDKKCEITELDYFSLYIPIKLTDINYPELDRFKHNSNTFINEHLLTTYIATKCFKNLLDFKEEISKYQSEIEEFYNDTFLWYVEISGEDIADYKTSFESGAACIKMMMRILEKMLANCKRYCKNIALLNDSNEEYKGSLCNYLEFLYPMLLKLSELSFMPKNKPIFLLVDDAGYLNNTQTKILNTWVSYRTSKEVSLKISTQLDYKSLNTVNGKTIDYPHDYSQINIATVYTTANRNYYQRIESIVSKRLNKFLAKDIKPKDFFPTDKKQEEEISRIYDEIKEQFTDVDRDYAGGDAARRYATSEFVKKLKKTRSGATFSYAGFDNLVNISSGIIRYFLEPASSMFSEHISRSGKISNEVDFIPDNVQNEVINTFSEKFLEDEFRKVFEEYGDKQVNERLSKADKLYNLISGLGGMFHKIFVSDRTERVVFSVALNDMPDKELKEILDLAMHYGYLHQSSIGNKQGTGRSKQYILSRTLAPFFKLDPTGFKGYKFMNSDMLKVSLVNPKKFIAETTKLFSTDENTQGVLFENLDE
jgi:hypothetical protein